LFAARNSRTTFICAAVGANLVAIWLRVRKCRNWGDVES